MKPVSVLNSLLGDLRAGRFRPRAIRRFVRDGIRHGIALAWGLRDLRRSFYAASAAMLLVLALLGATLEVLSPGGVQPGTWVAEGLLFVAVFGLTLLQLGLVRAESSGKVYDRFVFPNVLTLLRLLSIPYLVEGLGSPPGSTAAGFSFGLVLAAVLSDTLDGTLSRRMGLTSDFGRIYDPIVDTTFHSVMAVTLYRLGGVGWEYLGIVLIRYLLPPLAGTFLYLFREPFQVKATIMGKASSLALSVFVCAWACSRAFEWDLMARACRVVLEPVVVVVCVATVVSFLSRGTRILARGAGRGTR